MSTCILMLSVVFNFFKQKMNQLTHFMYESAHEHRQNYAAINAQLHMINERLRSSDSMSGSSSSVSSNIKMKKELLLKMH